MLSWQSSMRRRMRRGRQKLQHGRVEEGGEVGQEMEEGGIRHGGAVEDRDQQQQDRLGGTRGKEGAVKRNDELCLVPTKEYRDDESVYKIIVRKVM